MEITPLSTEARILCCQCGIVISPNSANMCISCIRNQVDITEGIPKQITITFCRNCGRYFQPPAQWLPCQLESKELLSLCLRRLKGLSKVRLIDAGFIWTEPHSRRLKLKLTVQKEIFSSTILQQMFVVEAVVCNLQCPDCTKLMAKDTWKSVVQLRQKIEHKRTFFYLEQLILKHALQKEIINIKQTKDGLDFFYSTKNHAIRMLDFLQSVVPIRYKTSEQLISEDIQSGTANYKFTFSAEIIPICKDDLVVLPAKIASSLSNIKPLVLCSKVGSSIHFLDPFSLQCIEMNSTVYWRTPFDSLCSSKNLSEFFVIDVEYDGKTDGKYGIADVVVARSSDFGVNTQTFTVKSHLGFILKPGNVVLGYDLTRENFNNDHLDALLEKGNFELPDVILVKKSYKEARREKHRIWKLKTLAKDSDDSVFNRKGDVEKMEADYEIFLQELEEDREMRTNVNLYKNSHVSKTLSNLKDIKMRDSPQSTKTAAENSSFRQQNRLAEQDVDFEIENENQLEEEFEQISQIDLAELLDDLEIAED